MLNVKLYRTLDWVLVIARCTYTVNFTRWSVSIAIIMLFLFIFYSKLAKYNVVVNDTWLG